MKWGSIFLLAILLWGCEVQNRSIILISKDNHSNIAKWLHLVDSSLVIKEFYNIQADSMDFYLSKAGGIILGGGEDVHPSMYGREDYLGVCGAIDLYRDSIERVLIDYAFKYKLPLLGICRGEQILNAGSGGTLIPDIPTYVQTSINHRAKGDSDHVVLFPADSWLKCLLQVDSIWVNSRHHQCIDTVAPGFVVAATAPDGIIESIRYRDTLQQPFIAGVQWHPEGLLDEPSIKIARYFLSKVY